MATNRYKSAAKAAKGSKRKDILPSAIRWVAFFLGAVYLGWALAFPQYSGVIGQGLSGVSTLALGSFITLAAIIAGSVAAFRYQIWRLEKFG